MVGLVLSDELSPSDFQVEPAVSSEVDIRRRARGPRAQPARGPDSRPVSPSRPGGKAGPLGPL